MYKKKIIAASLNTGQCSITCDIGGTATGSYTSSILASTAANSSFLSINSSNVNTTQVEQFIMYVPTGTAVGTYNLKSLSSSTIWLASYAKTNLTAQTTIGWAVNAGDGNAFTIVVTKSTSSEIEGTFSGTMNEDTNNTTISISNGKFAAKF